jgi:hypothetical protein
METHMKTTVELPDELLIAAKKRAAETGTTLKEIFERSLRRELSSSHGRKRPGRSAIRFLTVRGRGPEGLDLTSRAAMWDWIQRNR